MNAILDNPPNLDVLLDVPVNLTVHLGGCQMQMGEVLRLAAGSVVQLDKSADSPVELYVNGKCVARGEVVLVEERFGIKVTEVFGQTAS